jgi:hypothetical protein
MFRKIKEIIKKYRDYHDYVKYQQKIDDVNQQIRQFHAEKNRSYTPVFIDTFGLMDTVERMKNERN